jgi:branched-chain amino acid transport system permease protein
MKFVPKKISLEVALILIAAIAPLFIRSTFVMHVMVLLCVWVVLSLSLNFITGYAGQLALGHAAFVAIGGYAGAILMLDYGVSFWLAILVGAAISFGSGLILGILAMRLRGDYLGMVTMGFGEIVYLLAINLVDITRGPMGLPGVPRATILSYTFKGEIPYYYVALLLVGITFFAIKRMLFSRFGRACLAMRDDETAAEAMGVVSSHYKLLSFCISSGFAGLMGAFYVSWVTLISPDSFRLADSIIISAMITLGGIGSLYGPIFGGIVIGLLPELLRPLTAGPYLGSLRLAGVGLLMVVFIILKPAGLFGTDTKTIYLSLESFRNLLPRMRGLLRKEKNHG